MTEHFKNLLDYFSVTTGIALILNVAVPLLVGALTIAWMVYRLYDLHLAVKLKRKELGE